MMGRENRRFGLPRGRFWLVLGTLALAPLFHPSEPVAASKVPQEKLDRFYENWEKTWEELRSAAWTPPSPTPAPPPPAPAAAEAKEDDSIPTRPQGSEKKDVVVVGGKRIELPDKPEPVEPETDTNAPAGSAEVAASTGTAPPPPPPPPTPTPGLVKIKVTKNVDGKIKTVEIEVTPTPAPTEVAAPVAAATGAAAARVAAVTGEMGDLQTHLLEAESASSNKGIPFKRTEIATLLKEFMKAKRTREDFKKIVPDARARNVQTRLQRMASAAHGGKIEPPMAKILRKVLFPPPPAPVASTPQSATAEVAAATASVETATSEDDDYFLVEETTEEEFDENEIFYDPDTNQYVYWDGSPAEYVEPEAPVGQEDTGYVEQEEYYEDPPPEDAYYEEEPMEEPYYEEEYYEEAPVEQEYYEDDGGGEVYYEEEYVEEEYYEDDGGGEIYYEEEYIEEEYYEDDGGGEVYYEEEFY